MLKRYLSLLLVVAMCMAILPASAETTTYTGTAAGFGGQDVTAEVVMEDDKVVGLTIDDSTQSYQLNGVENLQPLVDAILAAGTAEGVDAVSNATVTSTAVLSIVNEALSGGPVDYSGIEITYNPGTYTGTGRGRNGELKAEVTFTADSIVSINVTEDVETPGISDMPKEKVPADIIAYQSLGVDAVTGATLTSNAIVTAVADAAEQAGANVAALRAVQVEYPVETVADMTTQIVVVGGGAAGLVAASKAADEGAQVVLVEKMPFLGGSLLVAAGGYATPANNEVMKADGISNDFDDTMAWVRSANENAHHQPDYDFIEYVLSETGKTMDYMIQDLKLPYFMTTPSASRCFVNTLLGGDRMGAGAVDHLAAHLQEKGVTVILNAAANEILVEDGKVCGIKATAKGGDFTVKADKVILATGGANYNQELMTSVTPALNRVTVDHQPLVGNTGDGWAMLNAIGAKMGDGPFLKPASTPSFAGVFGFTWRNTPSVNSDLIFDANGIRYIREDQGVAQNMSSGLAVEILRHGSEASYALFDTHNISEAFLAQLQSYTDNKNIVVYGKDIAEIAQKLNIDVDTLTDTYNRYQHLCATGVDVDQGKAQEYLIPYNDDNGLYAAFIQPGSYGTIGGVLTDRQFHALDANDAPIENLFAVGEIATSTLFGDYYMGAFSLGYYASMARIAAETAVAELSAN